MWNRKGSKQGRNKGKRQGSNPGSTAKQDMGIYQDEGVTRLCNK